MPIDFARELQRWGPDCDYSPSSLREAQAYCRRLAVSHYENFSVATFLAPRRLLRHLYHIYAYCRWADDLADESAGGAEAERLLAWWREELAAAYAGAPRHPVMVALQETVRQFAIPERPFLDLVTAFEQDQRVHAYATYADLLEYCRNSANPVGRLILYLGRCHDDERGHFSDQICTALQLANFWQDVARDQQISRIYLPLEDRVRFGYHDSDLHAGRFTPAFRNLMSFQVQRTRAMFLGGAPLVKMMPRELRMQVELYLRGGLAVLRKIERQNYNVWLQRPKLSKLDKAAIMARVWARRWHVGATA